MKLSYAMEAGSYAYDSNSHLLTVSCQESKVLQEAIVCAPMLQADLYVSLHIKFIL